MAGTLFGLGLSQQIDLNGNPLIGCLLYIYAAGTSTPATAYKNSALTVGQEHPFPIEADANGRLPQFWLADGTYRARLTDVDGVPQFDEDGVLALGPSSGDGGGSDTTPADSILKTGDFFWQPVSGTRSGCVRANGRTVGSSTSGGSERANADVQSLFTFLYTHFSDTLCPVSSGRGVSAAADWAANKNIATLDLRGMGAFGLADMGNSDSGALTSVTFGVGNATTAASTGGEALHALITAELAAHTHTGTTGGQSATHHHAVGMSSQQTNFGTNFTTGNTAGGGLNTGDASADHTHDITTASTGSGTAHNNMPPFRLGSWYIRL